MHAWNLGRSLSMIHTDMNLNLGPTYSLGFLTFFLLKEAVARRILSISFVKLRLSALMVAKHALKRVQFVRITFHGVSMDV